MFNIVSIIGCGLIGSSILRAIQNKKLANEVRVFDLSLIYNPSCVLQNSWVADPANRICDAPGSWYCEGQYPPALAPLIAKRKSFAQVEDFNTKGAEKNAYTEYVEKNQGVIN